MNYAGFWARFAAFVIDFFIILLGFVFIAFIESISDMVFSFLLGREAPVEVLFGVDFTIIFAIVGLFYTALFESSGWQATPGKRFLGIKVVDYEGKRIDFPQAFARAFCMYFSTLSLGIGYLMIAFTSHKQGLHDMMAKCYLIKNS